MTTQHAGFFQHLDKQKGGKNAIELGVQCTRKENSKNAIYFIKIRTKAHCRHII